MSERTIAAVATPLGESSIGVIRISGQEALSVADRVFFAFSGRPLSEHKGYTAAYGEIRDGESILDDAVAVVFKAPKSYTGEDVVELSLHGGKLLIVETLRLILAKGAVLAAPGEFTKRAFLNGKTDLTKAESIMGLISARSEAELRLSRAAHLGKVSTELAKIERRLVELDAAIAAFSDYPDEELEGVDNEHFLEALSFAERELAELLTSYQAGKILREGIETVIVGKPNVGKSTLMNLLSGAERSIVTDVAGTTRDVVEDTVTVGGLVLHLADTAGIHDTEDKVEAIGVSRARERIDAAGLVLAVLDGSQPIGTEDQALLQLLKNKNTLVILNKTDLPQKAERAALAGFTTVSVAAATGQGYEELCQEIRELSGTANLDPDSAVLLNERQYSLAARALDGVKEAKNALLSGNTTDAVGVCVDDAIAALFELSGKRVTNEVTDEIFHRFCVGK